EVVRGATVVNGSAITWPPPAPKVPAGPPKPAAPPAAQAKTPKPPDKASAAGPVVAAAVGAAALWAIGTYAPAAFITHFTIFVLACFVGYMVVWNVTPALHTPLMSVTNAISSII